MQGVPESIQRRQIALFSKCDPEYGAGVRRALNLEAADEQPSESAVSGPKTKATAAQPA
jgi:catalase